MQKSSTAQITRCGNALIGSGVLMTWGNMDQSVAMCDLCVTTKEKYYQSEKTPSQIKTRMVTGFRKIWKSEGMLRNAKINDSKSTGLTPESVQL